VHNSLEVNEYLVKVEEEGKKWALLLKRLLLRLLLLLLLLLPEHRYGFLRGGRVRNGHYYY